MIINTAEQIAKIQQERKDKVAAHAIVGRVDFSDNRIKYQQERKENFKNPVIYEDIDGLPYLNGAVDNLIDAYTQGLIRVEITKDGETLKIEGLPIKKDDLPDELGHIFVVVDAQSVGSLKNEKEAKFGNQQGLTYLQTIDFIVEAGCGNDFYGGEFLTDRTYVRLYFDTACILEERDVCLDLECIAVTPEEYPYSFAVQGGIPKRSLKRADKVFIKPAKDDWTMPEFPTDEEMKVVFEAERKKLEAFLQSLNKS